MSERSDPNEPFDVYADQFVVTITPFGANLSFGAREPHPSTTQAPQTTTYGTVRMSVEHLKTMVYLIRRQVMAVEHEAGVQAQVAPQVLNQMNVHPEDWNSFWEWKEFRL